MITEDDLFLDYLHSKGQFNDSTGFEVIDVQYLHGLFTVTLENLNANLATREISLIDFLVWLAGRIEND